jgi:hypothetical protein
MFLFFFIINFFFKFLKKKKKVNYWKNGLVCEECYEDCSVCTDGTD